MEGNDPADPAELAMLQLLGTKNAKVVNVRYKGDVPALTDLVGGQIHMIFTTGTTAPAFVKDGRARALLALQPQRSPLLPDLPTVAESGFPGFEATAWGGLTGPKGLPPAVVERLHGAVMKVLAGPFRGKQEALGATILGTTPAEFSAYFKAETDRWAKVITTAGIKAD